MHRADWNCPVWFLSKPAEQYVHSRVDLMFQSLRFEEQFRAHLLTDQSWFCTWQIPDILLGAGISLLAHTTPCGHQLMSRHFHKHLPAWTSSRWQPYALHTWLNQGSLKS